MLDCHGQIMPFKTNDGVYISDNRDFADYMVGKGFDLHDINCLIEGGPDFGIPGLEDDWVRRDQIDDYERMYDEVMCAFRNFTEEVVAMNKKFLSGRKLTKAQYVRELEHMLNHALEY